MATQTKIRRLKAKPDPNTCRHVTSLIADYLSGELDSRTTTAFEAHVRNCRDCVAFLNTYQKSVEATRQLRYETLPIELQERALKIIQEKTTRKPARRG